MDKITLQEKDLSDKNSEITGLKQKLAKAQQDLKTAREESRAAEHKELMGVNAKLRKDLDDEHRRLLVAQNKLQNQEINI